MKPLFAIFLLLLAAPALSQETKKLTRIAQDQDNAICVNDGGVEKCLTVDGPTAGLNLDGGPTGTDPIFTINEAGSSFQMRRKDDAGFGPAIQLIHDTTTPADGDAVGEILFRGRDSADSVVTYGRFRMLADDVTASTTDGTLYLWTAGGSGGETAKYKFTNDGSLALGSEISGLSSVTSAAVLSIDHDNLGSASPIVQIVDRTATADSSNDTILRLSFAGDTSVSGNYIRFSDSDTSTTGTINGASATTVAYTTTSDARLKDKIAPLTTEEGISFIRASQPWHFKWKKSGEEDVGFIAQEMKLLAPRAVFGDSDGDPNETPMQMDYGRITPQIVAGLKALLSKIETLEEENNALRARLDAAGL